MLSSLIPDSCELSERDLSQCNVDALKNLMKQNEVCVKHKLNTIEEAFETI